LLDGHSLQRIAQRLWWLLKDLTELAQLLRLWLTHPVFPATNRLIVHFDQPSQLGLRPMTLFSGTAQQLVLSPGYGLPFLRVWRLVQRFPVTVCRHQCTFPSCEKPISKKVWLLAIFRFMVAISRMRQKRS